MSSKRKEMQMKKIDIGNREGGALAAFRLRAPYLTK